MLTEMRLKKVVSRILLIISIILFLFIFTIFLNVFNNLFFVPNEIQYQNTYILSSENKEITLSDRKYQLLHDIQQVEVTETIYSLQWLDYEEKYKATISYQLDNKYYNSDYLINDKDIAMNNLQEKFKIYVTVIIMIIIFVCLIISFILYYLDYREFGCYEDIIRKYTYRGF